MRPTRCQLRQSCFSLNSLFSSVNALHAFPHSLSLSLFFSAATRDRTGDLQIFSLMLSQLSYSGFFLFHSPVDKRLSTAVQSLANSEAHLSATSLAGLEPAIFPLGEGRVNHYATETVLLCAATTLHVLFERFRRVRSTLPTLCSLLSQARC